ncbi:hypothetical protein HDU93_008890 [Gonapodya sp. JEL0774]|nr:hypothetical protein HDU93_008890 [Gonapodya sp. JEL0774]
MPVTTVQNGTTSLGELAFAASEAIGGVTLLTIAGFVLSHNKILTKELLKPLAELNLYFFTPCLLFSNMASSITAESILELWPLPAFHILFIVITWLTAQIGSWLLAVPKQTRPFVEAGIIFSNTNNWPVALVIALSGVSLLQMGPSDNAQEVLRRGLGYVFMYALFGNIVRWSWGYNLLAKGKRIEEEVLAETHNHRRRENFRQPSVSIDSSPNGVTAISQSLVSQSFLTLPATRPAQISTKDVPPSILLTTPTPTVDSVRGALEQPVAEPGDENEYQFSGVAMAADLHESPHKHLVNSESSNTLNDRTFSVNMGDDFTYPPAVPNGVTRQRRPTFTGNSFGWTPSYYSSDSDAESSRSVETQDPEEDANGSSGTFKTLPRSTKGKVGGHVRESEDVLDVVEDDNDFETGIGAEQQPLMGGRSGAFRRAPTAGMEGTTGASLRESLATFAIQLRDFGGLLLSTVKGYGEQVFNPPVFAALISIIVGVIAPLRNSLYGPGAPLKLLIAKPIELCGNASVPLTLVSLGGQLYKIYGRVAGPPMLRRDSTPRTPEQLEIEKARKTNRAIVLILSGRLVLMPIVSTALVLLTRRWLDLGLSDPMFVLTLMILGGGASLFYLELKLLVFNVARLHR